MLETVMTIGGAIAIASGALYAYEGFQFAAMAFDLSDACLDMRTCDLWDFSKTRKFKNAIEQGLFVSSIQAVGIFSGARLGWYNLLPGALIIFLLPILFLGFMFFSIFGILFIFFGLFWAVAVQFLLVAVLGGICFLIELWRY